MARFLNSKTLKDKIQIKLLLVHINMLSVNQLNAKIKLQEIWKAFNFEGYPLKIQNQSASYDTINTRAMTGNRPIEIDGSSLTEKTCVMQSDFGIKHHRVLKTVSHFIN